MKTSTVIISKKEGSWAEDERTRGRRTEKRIRDSPFAKQTGSARCFLPRPMCISHNSKTSSVLRSCSLLENGQPDRFDRKEINSLAHAPKIKGVPRRRSREKLHCRRDVIYENGVDRRVGVGAIVVTRGARKGTKERG